MKEEMISLPDDVKDLKQAAFGEEQEELK